MRHFASSWLAKSRSKSSRLASEVLGISSTPKTRKRPLPTHVRAVRDGNFYRLPIGNKIKGQNMKGNQSVAPVAGKPLGVVPSASAAAVSKSGSSTGVCWQIIKWFRKNLPVLALNFGSICILVGFARSDVLELRSLTMTGQITFALYNLGQATILWPSVLWSGIFASVNAFKIMNVFQERTAEVHMNERQERMFVDYFMNHGITPLQFSWIEEKAQILRVPQGECLIRKGEKVDRIFLVIEGSTHAHILGRRLTAASTSMETRGDQLEGGDSGAWIGEMAFLHWLHQRDDLAQSDSNEGFQGRIGRGVSMYTIIADEDCTVLSWSHETMAELMETSSDLRSALTRAMTAAVVGKVVNLSISDSHKISERGWTKWL